MSTTNTLLTILTERILTKTLVLPTLPEIALRVRKAADDPDIDLKSITRIIAQDPALTARMIRIANAASRSKVKKVTDLNQAVTRIGLFQIKNISTALAMEQLFVSNSSLIKKEMASAWKMSVLVTAHCLALYDTYSASTIDRSISKDALTLAAMVHNIGMLPILTEAERHQDVFANKEFLAQAYELVCQIGEMVVSDWGFTDDIVQAVKSWKMPQADVVDYATFIRLAYATIEKQDTSAFENIVPGGYNNAHYMAKVVEVLAIFS